MLTGPTRRVSRRSAARSPNAMFSALAPQLQSVLEAVHPPAPDMSDYYVCERLSTCSDEERNALIERMPADIQALLSKEERSCCRVDALEMDFIDFLLHYKTNRVMSVVGTVGVGKSTFLRYVLFKLRSLCVSLQKFVPVIVDCLRIGSGRPLKLDLLYEMSRALGETLITISVNEVVDKGQIEQLLTDFEILKVDLPAASHFIEFISRVKGSCRPGFEPLLVFDNLDHLDEAAIPEIGSLARAVHLNTGLCVVTAMRPSTHSTHSQSAYEKGAFYRYLLEVNPPDIRAVIRSRLSIAITSFKSIRPQTRTGLNLSIGDVERSLNSLCEKVMNARTQEIFLRDICENNVRRALKALEYFLKYRDLKYNFLFNLEEELADTLHGTWFEHLMDGLMIGDRDFYSDKESPISNILAFQYNGACDYLVLYMTLSVVRWQGRPFVDVQTLLNTMGTLGFGRTISGAASMYLLRRGLLYSPESETTLRGIRNLKLSDSGHYYLDFLIEHPQYLLNAVYDVPLPHSKWQEGNASNFSVRFNSIWELISEVRSAEDLMLERLLSDHTRVTTIGAIDQSGMLTSRLCKAAQSLLDDADHARSEFVKGVAREYGRRLQEIVAEVASNASKIRHTLESLKLLPTVPQPTETIEQSLGFSNALRLRVPKLLAPASENVVAIEIDLAGIEQVHPIVALWEATNQEERFLEMVELTRSTTKATYFGDFSISNVTKIIGFPDSSVTVFCATNPIVVAKLRGSQQHS